MSNCTIPRPEPQVLFDKIAADLSNTMLGGANIIPESNEWYMAAFHYEMMESYHAIANQAARERDARFACDDNLIELAASDGVFPRAAKPAKGYVKLTGDPGTSLPSTLTFDINGTAYTGTPTVTAIGTDGVAVVEICALVPGDGGNVSQVDTITMTTALAGVDVELCGELACGGCDEESVSDLRQRYLQRIQHQPRALSSWLLSKALEWPCATRAMPRAGSCCSCSCNSRGALGSSSDDGCEKCGCVECGGTTDLYVMFDDSFPNGIAPRSVLDDVQDWLFGSPQGYGLGCVEIGVCGRVVSVTPVEFDMLVTVDGCPTPAELELASALVSEFMTTVEPSRPVQTDALVTSLSRVLPRLNFNAIVTLCDPAVGYGNTIGPQTETSQVYVTPCGFEPDCDHMMVLKNLNIVSQVQSVGGC